MPLGETIGRAYIKILADGSGFDEDVRRNIDDAGPEFEKGGEESSKKFWSKFRGTSKKEGREHRKDVKRTLDDLKGDLERFGKTVAGVGNVIGSAFGRGSRNDFLNLFGSIVSAVPRAAGSLVTFMSKVKVFDKLLADSEGNLRGFVEVFGTLGKVLGPLVQIAVVAALIRGFVAVMGIAGSAISLLSGLVLALAGSIGFALVGALVAVGGALVPFAAGIGVAALAIGKLDKKSQVFKDLKKDWKDLQKTTAQRIFGKDMGGLSAIRSVLKGVQPIIDAVASALGGLLIYLGEAAKSTGFQTLMQSIAAVIGPMVTQLGQIGGNIAIFLGEAFVAAAPMIEEFLGWLLGVTEALVDFGKPGKGGKSGLSTFFEGAWESAKKVGGFVLQVIGLVGDLLGMGKTTGDNIFVKLTGWVEKLRKWLSDPANSKQIDQWFQDAEKLGDKIGEVVLAVLDLVDKLDTEGNRRMLFAVLDVLTWIIDKFGDVMVKVDDLNTKMLTLGDKLATTFEDAKTGAESVDWGSTADSWKQQIVDSFSLLKADIGAQLSGLASSVFSQAGDAKAAFDLWWAGVTTGVAGVISSIVTQFTGLASQITTAAGNFGQALALWFVTAGPAAITVAGQIITGFIDLAGRIIRAAGGVGGRFTQWLADLPGRAVQATVNIAVAFTNLAIKIILAAGNIGVQFGNWLRSLPGKARQTAADVVAGLRNLGTRMITAAGNLAARFATWVASLPGKARTLAINIINGMTNLAGRMIQRAGDLAAKFASWVNSLPGKAAKIASDIANAFSGLASKAMQKAGSITSAISSWASGVYSSAKGVANDIVRAFSGLASDIVHAIGDIVPTIRMPHINIPHITAIVDKPTAAGGVFSGAQVRMIGEAGPEAVVPLNRSLSLVDPAVRALSAIAQGKVPGMANGGVSTGKTIDIGGITINTPTQDPRAVASEVVAHMAAASYI